MTLTESYFDKLYAASPDPWGLSTRWYEARKYAITLASLPRNRYRRAFEPGCSIGVLTAMLAQRCEELISIDSSSAAVALAAQRVNSPAARIEQGSIPSQWPSGTFDLIVLSEVCYYFDIGDLHNVMTHAVDSLAEDGHLIVVHWRAEVREYPIDAQLVRQVFRSCTSLKMLAEYSDEFFLLDIFGVGDSAGLVGPEQPPHT